MAGSVNKVILVGNLGRDPEIRSTQDGTRVVNLSVATSESWRDKNSGERRERTEWHRVVVFNDRLVDVCERFLKKGSKIKGIRLVEGNDGHNVDCKTDLGPMLLKSEFLKKA